MPDDCNDMLKYFILQVDIKCKQCKSPGNSLGSRFYHDRQLKGFDKVKSLVTMSSKQHDEDVANL
jgi:hypothetical protein